MSLANLDAHTQTPPLQVRLAGFDRRSSAAMELLFSGPGHGAFVVAARHEGEASADVVIIDMDCLHAEAHWEQCKQQLPDAPTIALSLREQQIAGARCLRKPVRMRELLSALHEIREALAGKPGGALTEAPVQPGGVAREQVDKQSGRRAEDITGRKRNGKSESVHSAAQRIEHRTSERYMGAVPEAPKIDVNDPQQRRRLFFSPDTLLGGRISKTIQVAIDENAPWEIVCWHGRILIVPALNKVITDLASVRLKQACLIHCTEDPAPPLPFEFDAQRLPRDQAMSKVNDYLSRGMTQMGLQSFIWEISVWISRGRVPEGIDLDQPVVMRYWPNMTRLLITPNAFRIAALWSQKPYSLPDTAESLRISLSHVLTFYTAARSIGLVAESKRQEDTLFKPGPVVENKRRGIMQRILNKIRRSGSRELSPSPALR